jgi:amino-acid N-acetyltransferase
MTDHDLALEPATGADLQYVESLGERNGLPTDDLDPERDALSVYVCIRGDERIGAGGVETYGTAGLLRSVVVEEEARGEGVGRALCEGLAERAAAAGVRRLYLLTTTARDFFPTLGYEEVDREDVPAPIRETRQFSELCPSSAACLCKSVWK